MGPLLTQPCDFDQAGLAEPDDPEPPAEPLVSLCDTTESLTGNVLYIIQSQACLAACTAGATQGEVRVRLLDDASMSQAHADHLGDASITDVITFDLAEGASIDGVPLDIDLLVCLDEAHRQSKRLGHPIERELVLYILHGLLHCLGYDDHTETDAAAMHAREDEILISMGLGAAYAPDNLHSPDTE